MVMTGRGGPVAPGGGNGPRGPDRAAGRAPGERPHPTPAERRSLGKAARALVPRSSHAEFVRLPDRTDPVGLLEEQAAPGSRSWCRSATGGCWVVVHVLPGRRPGDGLRPGLRRRVGTDRPGVRGRTPVELRDVRLAGAHADLRPERLRRDPAGTVGVGRQAPDGEPRRGRSRQGVLEGQAAPSPPAAHAYRTTMRVSRHDRTSTSGMRTSIPSRHGPSTDRSSAKADGARSGAAGEARTHDSRRRSPADGRGRRGAPDRQRAAVARPAGGAGGRGDVRGPPGAGGRDGPVPAIPGTDRRHLLEQFRVVQIARKVVGVGSVGRAVDHAHDGA